MKALLLASVFVLSACQSIAPVAEPSGQSIVQSNAILKARVVQTELVGRSQQIGAYIVRVHLLAEDVLSGVMDKTPSVVLLEMWEMPRLGVELVIVLHEGADLSKHVVPWSTLRSFACFEGEPWPHAAGEYWVTLSGEASQGPKCLEAS